MKYRAGIIFYTNCEVDADSRDDALNKFNDLIARFEHDEVDASCSQIEIIDVEEAT